MSSNPTPGPIAVNSRDWQTLVVLRGHTDRVNSAAFSPDGKFVVSSSWDRTAIIWDVNTWQSRMVLRGHILEVNSAAFSANNKLVITASGDGSAWIWDATTGRNLTQLHGHTAFLTGAAFSPDGRYVVTASGDKSARVWEASSGLHIADLRGHTDIVTSATFSQDGRWVVTASLDGTAQVRETNTGKSTLELRGHANSVWSAGFSPDGKSIVTASGDGTSRIWDAKSGAMIAELRGPFEHCTKSIFRLQRRPNCHVQRRWHGSRVGNEQTLSLDKDCHELFAMRQHIASRCLVLCLLWHNATSKARSALEHRSWHSLVHWRYNRTRSVVADDPKALSKLGPNAVRHVGRINSDCSITNHDRIIKCNSFYAPGAGAIDSDSTTRIDFRC